MLAFFFKVNLLKDAGRIAHLNGGLDFIGVVVLRRFADYPEKKRQTYLQSYSCTFSDHSYSESMFHFQFPFYFQLTVALRRLTYNSRIWLTDLTLFIMPVMLGRVGWFDRKYVTSRMPQRKLWVPPITQITKSYSLKSIRGNGLQQNVCFTWAAKTCAYVENHLFNNRTKSNTECLLQIMSRKQQ